MNHSASPSTPHSPQTAHSPRAAGRRGRLMIDAPTRAFHWLFALSFAGAWLTAESERWRDVHVTLGYAFGGLLLFRVVYGLFGPRQARLSMLWHRVSGLGDWLRGALAGRTDLSRLTTLGMGLAMLLLIVLAAPLVLSGYAGHIDWLGQEDALEEVHEFFANTALALVMAHLALMALLSVMRRRNLAQPMVTGRAEGPGPDLVKANRAWLAAALVTAWIGFMAWQTQPGPTPSPSTGIGWQSDGLREGSRHGGPHGGPAHGRPHRAHDDDD
ncbi:cytochrome b/b6 domain-containing protein [Pelomonas sp. APW6]|uniref:Cytochrome b/b6 domain-containing protein n=1 Tax=Roseateles subflavus TaxID=3053353 RepID=A0ABT7LT70_9BURK|nr:cytochrome b/b6 domain-containing protein [Pelomonas sp. APW6]MDL5034691.1 cytochrome b/b6 domain-containing protein [Pelomonas sp. APW6]